MLQKTKTPVILNFSPSPQEAQDNWTTLYSCMLICIKRTLTFVKPYLMFYFTMVASGIQWLIQIFMLVNDVTQKRFEFSIYYIAIARQS